MKVIIGSLLSFAVLVVSQTALASNVVSKASANAYINRETTVVGIDLIINNVIKCGSVDENLVEAVIESEEGVRLLIADKITCLELVGRARGGSVSVVVLEDDGLETQYEKSEQGCMKSEGRFVTLKIAGLTEEAEFMGTSLISSLGIVQDSYCQ